MNEYQLNLLINSRIDLTRNYRILCFVSGDYHWLIEPYIYLHDKYWGEPITFVSDRYFNTNHKIEALTIVDDFRKPGFGAEIKNVISRFREDYFVLSLPDYWICEPVNRINIHDLCDVFKQYPDIAKINLHQDRCPDMWGYTFAKREGYFLTRVLSHNQHCGTFGGTMMFLGIWRKKFLLEFLDDGWTPWEIETHGTAKMRFQKEWVSVCTTPAMIKVQNVTALAYPTEARITDIRQEDRMFVKKYIPFNYKIL